MKPFIQTPQTSKRTFRPAIRADKQRVVEILTEAFHDDPQILWFAGNGPSQKVRIRALMAFAFEQRILAGDVMISLDGNAAAIWKRDHTTRFSLPLMREYLRFMRQYGFADIKEITRMDNIIRSRYPKKQAFHYLWILGVDPAHQGKGLSKQMMIPFLEEAEQQGIPVYLETSKSRNLPIYQKRGFEVYDEMVVESRDPFRLFFMKKDPQTD